MSSAKVVVTTEYEISKPGRLSRECTITATRCVSGDGTLSYATQSIVTRYTDLDSFLRHSGQAHVLSNALQARLDANARLTRAYPYWYAAVYELRWSNRLKRPVLKFVAAASKARRSRAKAMADTCDAGTIGHVFELQPTRATLLDPASAFVGRV